ncbi:MAG: protein kinase [Phycisphaerae bacterium]|nr:protein kinase [Phycisphaerae bacterium]
MSDANQHGRVKSLFLEAQKRPPEEQARIAERADAEDPCIGAELRRLLAHNAEGSKFLEEPLEIDDPKLLEVGNEAGGSGLAGLAADAGAIPTPTQVGRYAVVRRIGIGGMGEVYEARQDEPQRTVAIKVIRAGLASASAMRRFRHEAEVLARLEHVSIAHIYDAGLADVRYEDGSSVRRPFFAMELVRGRALTEFARERRVGMSERVELMAEVCDAVHHAHQKGVIHRDLKPGNILINESGQPKILDFGVARATDADVQTVTTQTAVGQLVGTIPYMSPEQLPGKTAELDTRSDVYALGVILYELLGGRLPHDVVGCSLTEAVRRIDLRDPPRLASLNTACRGDLETIVHKALEREKERRYQSAAELAVDLRRCLANEPIAARPATMLYQLRKLARRHRGATAGLGVALLAVVLGVAGITWFALDAAAKKREARWLAYKASMVAAEAALSSYDVPAAREALTGAPKEYRGWEWDHLSNRLIQWDLEFESSLDARGAVCASPDGTLIASARSDGTVGMWDAATGRMKAVHDLGIRITMIGKMAPDGIAVGAAEDGRVVRFVLSSGAVLSFVGDDEAGPALGVSACDDGSRVCTLHERAVRVWDVATGGCVFFREFEWERGRIGRVATINHAGSQVVVGASNLVRIIDLDTHEESDTPTLPDSPCSLAFAPDDGLLAIGSSSQSVHLVDTADCRLIERLRGHASYVDDVGFFPDGTLISSSRDGTIKVWAGASQWTCFTLHAPARARGTSVTPLDNQRLVSNAGAQTPMLRWSRADADPSLLGKHLIYVYGLAWSPDSRLLASMPWFGGERIAVWDVATGCEAASIPDSGASEGPLAFSRDGTRLLFPIMIPDGSGDYIRDAALWDTGTWREVRRCTAGALMGRANGEIVAWLGGPEGLRLSKVRTFSPDGKLCAFSDPAEDSYDERRFHVADSTGTVVADLTPRGCVQGAAFSPDGRLLATACMENVVLVWDTRTFELLRRLEHRSGMYAVAFSPDGTRLVTGGMDSVIHVWDTQTWHPIVDLRGHASYVYDLVFSPDGSYLASCGGDVTVRLWRTRPQAE